MATWIDELKNSSKIEIEINTKFKKQMYKEKGWDAEDITLDIEKAFHEAVYKYIEDKLVDNDEFEQEILELMSDDENLIEGTDEFSKLGQISIRISQPECSVKSEKQRTLELGEKYKIPEEQLNALQKSSASDKEK